MRLINELIIHCSATRPSMDIGVAEIREWHLDRGWSDIGYHYVIKRDGSIENGRPVAKSGAHAKGRNANSIGICLIGGVKQEDGKTPDANFTYEQYEALNVFVTKLEREYPEIHSIIGHRDIPGVWKACPCFDVKTFFNSVF